MKIRYEDAELEEFALTEGDIAVPVEIYIPADGSEPEMTVFSAFGCCADDFVRLHASEPLGDAAIQFWRSCLSSAMKERDFELSPDNEMRIREYKLSEKDMLNRKCILPDTRIIRSKEELARLKSAVTHIPDEDYDDILCAVHVIDGVIVACAAENDSYFEDDSMEIHVECAPQFRNRGFSSSCAAALAEAILAEETPVRYHCRTTNSASVRVAEKAGFRLLGTRFSQVCYRRGSV